MYFFLIGVSYGRGAGVERDLSNTFGLAVGVGLTVGVALGVLVGVAVAVAVAVALGEIVSSAKNTATTNKPRDQQCTRMWKGGFGSGVDFHLLSGISV